MESGDQLHFKQEEEEEEEEEDLEKAAATTNNNIGIEKTGEFDHEI